MKETENKKIECKIKGTKPESKDEEHLGSKV